MALASGGVESGNGNEGRNRPSSLLGSRCQGLVGRRRAKQHEPRLWIVQSFGDGARFLARRAFIRGYVPNIQMGTDRHCFAIQCAQPSTAQTGGTERECAVGWQYW